jgi:hypothetical protein
LKLVDGRRYRTDSTLRHALPIGELAYVGFAYFSLERITLPPVASLMNRNCGQSSASAFAYSVRIRGTFYAVLDAVRCPYSIGFDCLELAAALLDQEYVTIDNAPSFNHANESPPIVPGCYIETFPCAPTCNELLKLPVEFRVIRASLKVETGNVI